jgi:putative ABC transport system ATP-binding protein
VSPSGGARAAVAAPAGEAASAGSGPPLVRVEGLARTYDGPPPVRALAPCSLDVAAGEHLTVMGPSGSGKSTLLNLLGLLDRPSEGRYLLDGADTGRLPERERGRLRGQALGFVFQFFHLLAYRTAVENVELGLLYAGVPRRRRRPLALTALDRVGLGHRREAHPTTLSGGERQRVAIARAVATEPRLLLCDEPTGNLDSETSAAILDLLTSLRRDGLTLIVVTHEAAVADRASRLVVIRDGVATEQTPARPDRDDDAAR